MQNVLVREGVLAAKIWRSPSVGNVTADQIVPDRTSERTRLVEFRFKPSDRILFEAGDVVVVGQVIARADISSKLEELTVNSRRDIERLIQELQELQLELAGTRDKLTKKNEEKDRIEEELNRLRKEPLLVTDRVRLRKSRDALERDAAQLREKIADLHRKALQLEERKLQSVEIASRKRTILEREAAIQASFSGKILRIDRQPEGEKIRLSVLFQQGTQ